MNEHNDPADIIAGALKVSRGYAYDLMCKAVSERYVAPVKPEAVEPWALLLDIRGAFDDWKADSGDIGRIARLYISAIDAALSTQAAVPATPLLGASASPTALSAPALRASAPIAGADRGAFDNFPDDYEVN